MSPLMKVHQHLHQRLMRTVRAVLLIVQWLWRLARVQNPVGHQFRMSLCVTPLKRSVAKLQQWASAFSVPLVAVTALLAILRMHHPDLPKDARTLLKTQAKIPVERVGSGEYYHVGLEKGILSRLSSIHCLSNYKKMEETQSHRQSPSVWGFTQDIASWNINDDEKGQGSAQYYTGGAC